MLVRLCVNRACVRVCVCESVCAELGPCRS